MNEAMKPDQAAEAAALRQSAEEQLQSCIPSNTAPLSADETRRLLHELQVHQIELEMQNEELRSSRAQLETAVAGYTNLYDFAPAGYFTLDRNGEITQTNLVGARLLGLERAKLSASIAHEFNNSLQGVTSIVQGIKKRTDLDHDDTELVDLAIKECHRMRDLIKSLQDFNRPTSARKAPMDIHATLESIYLLCKKEYTNRKISITTKYAENLPQIMAVSDQFKQVFLNLLDNASDACVQGGNITIETDSVEDNVVIRVHDTGCGIRPDDREYIFDPFFTTKAGMKGTGLGLPVSYGIVKAHGGEISVESKPGKGTIFSIVLPIKGGSDEEK